ncbi:UNVERIFIED_CONTAM: hypothetical protein GTU68_035586 [Idotea baltica]|nr:hypothetical protein [Idotea baltica]
MTNTPSILVVEDEPALLELLLQNLKFEGYHVIEARNGQDALKQIETRTVDLMILDLMLPKMSGIEVCKHLRAKGNALPIIMLTARGTQSDKIRGLKIGADDYVTKPFDLMELLARIEAILRRNRTTPVYEESYLLGEMKFDFVQHTIQKETSLTSLTQQEMLLLRYLVHHEREVLSREQIFQDVWGHDYLYSHRTIDTHITKLRQKIEIYPSKPRHILTIHRVGYKFLP